MADAMPIIPGLAGAPQTDEEAEPNGIAALLDAVDDDALTALQEAAAASLDAGELDELLAQGGDNDGESDGGEDEAEAGPAVPLEGGSADESDGDAGDEEDDPTPHVRAAEDAAKSASDAMSELSTLVEQASEHEKAGLDVDGLQDMLEEAQEACDEAEQANEDAHGADAADAEDYAETAKEAAATVVQALADAKAKIAADTKTATEAAVPDEVRAMTAWAQKTLGTA